MAWTSPIGLAFPFPLSPSYAITVDACVWSQFASGLSARRSQGPTYKFWPRDPLPLPTTHSLQPSSSTTRISSPTRPYISTFRLQHVPLASVSQMCALRHNNVGSLTRRVSRVCHVYLQCGHMVNVVRPSLTRPFVEYSHLIPIARRARQSLHLRQWAPLIISLDPMRQPQL